MKLTLRLQPAAVRALPVGPGRTRRCALLAAAALGAMLAWLQPPAVQAAPASNIEHFVATFGRAPAGPPAVANTEVLSNQTLRLIAHSSIGGTRVRVRVSNEMGATPLRIGAASIALRQSGAQTIAGSNRALTFSGAASITLPPGAPALSDPVDLSFAALSDLVVSLYLPASTPLTSVHPNPLQTTYLSSAGNFTNAVNFPVARSVLWAFLTEVEVTGSGGAIIALGDSITDGSASTVNSNNRWTDLLARRLQATADSSGNLARQGVVNRGISGNSLLSSVAPGSLGGRSGLERFERDVLATTGARYLIAALGINDIGYASSSAPMTAATLIAGYRQLIARAHARGIAVFGATLGPFQGADYYSLTKDATRQAVNNWIRTGNEFDGVIDFDRALADPSNVLRLRPGYDSGDHLHPNNAGYQAMANGVSLDLFHLLDTSTMQALPEAPALLQ